MKRKNADQSSALDVSGQTLQTAQVKWGGYTLSQPGVGKAGLAKGIPCFTAGTPIATPKGEVFVENLRLGDKVFTRDNGLQEIRWIGRRTLRKEDLRTRPHLCPVRIGKGALGNVRDLYFSPQHGILNPATKSSGEKLIRAAHLARMPGGAVRIANGIRNVTYIHLLFDRHQIVLSGGVWTESYYPGPNALNMLNRREIRELHELFPSLMEKGAKHAIGGKARDFPTFKQLKGTVHDLRIETT